MVLQDAALATRSEGTRDLGALLLCEGHAAVSVVHGVGLAQELARVLRDDFQAPAHYRQGLASGVVAVTRSVHVRAGLVDGGGG